MFAVFETLVFTPLSNSSKVLIMTVPECHVRAKALDEKREQLNDLLVYNLGRKDNVYVSLSLTNSSLSHFLISPQKILWLLKMSRRWEEMGIDEYWHTNQTHQKTAVYLISAVKCPITTWNRVEERVSGTTGCILRKRDIGKWELWWGRR